MEDTLWTEIADAPGEIFDIDIDEEELEQTFESKLNSNFDFWTMSIDSATKLFDDKIVKEFFTDSELDLIYNFIGHALDDDEYDPEDVYAIRRKIHSLYKKDAWNLQLYWRCCDSSRTGRCHLYWHHRGAMLHSLLQFSPEEMNYLTSDDLNNLIRLVEENNQYNDDDDKEFWDDVMIRLNQEYRHCLDDF